MRCPRCSSENAQSTTSCVHCGTPLRAARPISKKRIPWYAYLVIGLVLAAFASYLVFQDRSGSPRDGSAETVVESESSQNSIAPESSEAMESLALSLGQVVVRTRLGEHVYRARSAVMDGTWIALPLWSFVGGDVWRFQGDEGEEIRITHGFWKEGMPLGLWQLDTPLGGDSSPPLSPWDKNAPLYWQSLQPAAPLNRVSLDTSPQPYGDLARFPIPAHFKTEGVFLQQNRIVGWTFGSGWDHALLWIGADMAELDPNIRASDLVGVAFAESQERSASRALGMDERNNDLPKLRALAEGLSLPARIAPEDKPDHLQLPSLLKQTTQYANKILQSGQAEELTRILDENVIRPSRDIELLKIATRARLSALDHRRALRFFESLKDSVSSDSRLDRASLDRFHLSLYKEWIQGDIEQELFSRGWEAFEAGQNAFPEDVDLHLLGVELAIAGKEWSRAEDLLKNRSFPSAFKTRASTLELIILERRSEEGKVTIRFPSGAAEIPLDVLLNKRMIQRFIVDTGATMVTIPSSTLEQLGIEIDNDTPVHRVSTASGYMIAYEVSLNQMEVKGQRVFNVPALVIDIPGQPGIGLLGQSFLKYFELEIDSRRGILRLKRK